MSRSCLMAMLFTATLLIFGWDTVAYACPNCRDAMASDPAQAGLVRGFFWSILFMVSMPFLIFSGIGSYFYWEVCRAKRAAAIRNASAVIAADDELLPDLESADEEEMEPLVVGW